MFCNAFIIVTDEDSLLYLRWYQGFVPLSRYPDYFRTYGPKEPQTTNHVPITFAAGKPELGFFDMLAQDPDSLARFADAMASGAALFPIIGVYDFSWLIDQVKMSPGSERAIFVDVGGGVGHAIKAIHGAYPQLPIGRFVLQDTPETLAFGTDDTALAGIQRVPINFHKEAPVKGKQALCCRHKSTWGIKFGAMLIDCRVQVPTLIGYAGVYTTMAIRLARTSCVLLPVLWRKTAGF